tara:strand:- start:179 stop:481 length:303 start_codon:yes stop_codon:yes gene_type:complete
MAMVPKQQWSMSDRPTPSQIAQLTKITGDMVELSIAIRRTYKEHQPPHDIAEKFMGCTERTIRRYLNGAVYRAPLAHIQHLLFLAGYTLKIEIVPLEHED